MRRLATLCFSLLILPVAAHADSFNISVSANGTVGTGTLTGTSNGDGSYTLRSISGSNFFGSSSPVVLLPKNDPYFGSDDLFFPANARLFDVNGITFAGAFGVANLFSTINGYEVQGYDSNSDYFDFPASVNLLASATPEPSSIVLSFTGLVGAAATALRRRKALIA